MKNTVNKILKKEIIEVVNNKKILFEREGYWLKKYNCATNSKYYNLTNTSNCGLLVDGKTKEELKAIAAKRLATMKPIQKQTTMKMVQARKNWSTEKKQAYKEVCSRASKLKWKKMTSEQKAARMQKILNTKNNLPEWKKQLTSKKHSEQSKKWWASLTLEQRKEHGMNAGGKNKGRINSDIARKNISDGVKRYILNMSEADKKAKIKRYKTISTKISATRWCNDGIKNYRKTSEQIKLLGYKIGKVRQ